MGFLLALIVTLGVICCSISTTAETTQNTSTIAGILDTCYGFLEEHLCQGRKWGKPFHFYKPSTDKYSADQWLWDSGSHMIVWSNRNVTNSILDLRTMLLMQQPNGRIPEEIFWSERTALQDAEILLQYSSTQFTDTTQMPVLPYSLRAIAQRSPVAMRKSVIKEFLYPLVNYFKWWRAERDIGDGLVIAVHNWETGLDASPAYDPAFHVYVTELNEESFRSLYPKFIEIAESYKFLYQWNMTKILGRTEAPEKPQRIDNWFMVKDVGLNSVYASGWKVLADLARDIDDTETADYCDAQYKISRDAIVNKMFIKEQDRFQTLYIDSDGIEKASIANTVQNLFPLLLQDLPEENVEKIVSEVKDEKKFMGPFALTTVAMDDPQFSATFDVDLMWRGPVWGFTNWFVMEGLGLHKKMAVQKQVLEKWVSLVQTSGIYEHYNPLNGEPYGPVGLGMSTLVCDWIYRYGWDINPPAAFSSATSAVSK